MNDRAILSVGLTQDFAECEKRKEFMPWLGTKAPMCDKANNAMQHIYELEALIQIEKYATLSNMANEMRNHLAEIRLKQSGKETTGYQLAINLVIDTLEDIDKETQAATSIAEIQAASLLSIATEIRSTEDYQTVVQFAKAINEGCC